MITRRPQALLLLVAAGLVAALAGCAGRRAAPVTVADAATAPWEVPASAFGTQRLVRVGYDGPDGGGSFRLTLRLAAADRYQVRAVDPVGRALWSLDVAGTAGLWLDHRARAACRIEGSLELTAGRLTPFPLAALPALLLGRLPAAPAGELEEAGEEGEEGVAFTDADGRRWSATLDGNLPLSWAMTEPGETMPSVWWRRHAGEQLLSDRPRNVQLRWRETVVEPLAGGLAPLSLTLEMPARAPGNRSSCRASDRARAPPP
ncbi:MAG TPA: hypothetical protein VF100_05395 [Thermoanaerobaculia bacterium]